MGEQISDNFGQESLDLSVNGNNGFKFSMDSLPIKPLSPSLPLTTTNLRFASQGDLGKLFAIQGNLDNVSSSPSIADQLEPQPHFILDSPDETSGHRRRDSNVSAMSIQLYDVIGSGHQRRDSNVSNMSMQLDTPSETESGNEDESKLAFFPFTFSQRPLSMSIPGTPTTPPSHISNFYSSTTRPLMSHHPQRIRRMSLDLNVDSNGDPKIEKPSPMHRAVKARRASLLPKTKSFQRVVNELQEELQPIETEIKQEYKTTKEFLNNWIKFRDIQPSPPVSKLNPEVDMSFRQDTPSPTSSVGAWSISGRIKRKASEDRFEPYFNPKRRAVSPSLAASPPIVSSVPSPPNVANSPSFSGTASSNGNCSTRGQIKGNSNLVNMQDANGSFSRMSLNGE
ncbi:9792_t:CDS:2 [Funneliformis geosporum]|uniref:9785_t:CDS:1 n=1 Tax=Funneliformis geosporum TaxID=1117311 RepID=A0A9W4SUH6_9GLOM|nr:9792_t:CDS:2 [Funneliformis geosporum]CAI2183655.1 9785_t:CDS:2 [Funneliformis geosporum]